MDSGRPETKHVLFIQQARENSEIERCTDRYSSRFENNCFTEMCSGSEVGSNLRLIDFVYHSTLGLRVIKKKKKKKESVTIRKGEKRLQMFPEFKKPHAPRGLPHSSAVVFRFYNTCAAYTTTCIAMSSHSGDMAI